MRVVMNKQGQVTIPAELREALGETGFAEFEVQVDCETHVLTMEYVSTIPDEDAWAYTEEHLASIARAEEDVRAGRVRRMTIEELEALAPIDPE